MGQRITYTENLTVDPFSVEWNSDLDKYAVEISKAVDLLTMKLVIIDLGLQCTPEQLRNSLAKALTRVQLGTKREITHIEVKEVDN